MRIPEEYSGRLEPRLSRTYLDMVAYECSISSDEVGVKAMMLGEHLGRMLGTRSHLIKLRLILSLIDSDIIDISEWRKVPTWPALEDAVNIMGPMCPTNHLLLIYAIYLMENPSSNSTAIRRLIEDLGMDCIEEELDRRAVEIKKTLAGVRRLSKELIKFKPTPIRDVGDGEDLMIYTPEQLSDIRETIISIMAPYDIGDKLGVLIPKLRNNVRDLISVRVVISVIDIINPTREELVEIGSICNGLWGKGASDEVDVVTIQREPYLIDTDTLVDILRHISPKISSPSLSIKIATAMPKSVAPHRLGTYSIRWIGMHGLEAYTALSCEAVTAVALGEYVPSPLAPFTNGDAGGVGTDPSIYDGCSVEPSRLNITYEDGFDGSR